MPDYQRMAELSKKAQETGKQQYYIDSSGQVITASPEGIVTNPTGSGGSFTPAQVEIHAQLSSQGVNLTPAVRDQIALGLQGEVKTALSGSDPTGFTVRTDQGEATISSGITAESMRGASGSVLKRGYTSVNGQEVPASQTYNVQVTEKEKKTVELLERSGYFGSSGDLSPKEAFTLLLLKKETGIDKTPTGVIHKMGVPVLESFTATPKGSSAQGYIYETPYGDVTAWPEDLTGKIQEKQMAISTEFQMDQFLKKYPSYQWENTGNPIIDTYAHQHPELSKKQIMGLYESATGPFAQFGYFAPKIATGTFGLASSMAGYGSVFGITNKQDLYDWKIQEQMAIMDIHRSIRYGTSDKYWEYAGPQLITTGLMLATAGGSAVIDKASGYLLSYTGKIGQIAPYLPFAFKTGVASYFTAQSTWSVAEGLSKISKHEASGYENLASGSIGLAYSTYGMKQAWASLPVKVSVDGKTLKVPKNLIEEVPIPKSKFTYKLEDLEAQLIKMGNEVGETRTTGRIVGKIGDRAFTGDVDFSSLYQKTRGVSEAGFYEFDPNQKLLLNQKYSYSKKDVAGIFSIGEGVASIEIPRIFRVKGTDITFTQGSYTSTIPLFAEAFSPTKTNLDPFAKSNFLSMSNKFINEKLKVSLKSWWQGAGEITPTMVFENKPVEAIFKVSSGRTSISHQGSTYFSKMQDAIGRIKIFYEKPRDYIRQFSNKGLEFDFNINADVRANNNVKLKPINFGETTSVVKTPDYFSAISQAVLSKTDTSSLGSTVGALGSMNFNIPDVKVTPIKAFGIVTPSATRTTSKGTTVRPDLKIDTLKLEKIMPELDLGSSSINLDLNINKDLNKMIVGTSIDTKQLQGQKVSQKLDQAQIVALTPSFSMPNITPEINFDQGFIWLPSWPTGTPKKRRSKKFKGSKRDLFYTPSFIAIQFGITGKMPRFLTGLEIRPIPSRTKKSKKSSRRKKKRSRDPFDPSKIFDFSF